MLVTPSILTDSAADACRQIDRLLPYFNTFQIDIADGKFVPNTTVTIPELEIYIKEHALQEKYNDFTFDFHLMVQDYHSHLEQLSNLSTHIKIGNIFIHGSLKPNLKMLKQEFPQFSIGLVLNPEDTVQFFTTIYPLGEVPFVQIMSVNPGFQGSPFIKEMLYKIEQLRKAHYRNKVYLDGGINKDTLSVILSQQYTPDVIGPGSYISKAENIEERVRELQDILKTK